MQMVNKNGIGTDYSLSFLSFNEEFLNGLSRKGKEYFNKDKIKFEGEYLNGEKHGKGKEYSYNNKNQVIFEGDYLYGNKFKGKEYIIF